MFWKKTNNYKQYEKYKKKDLLKLTLEDNLVPQGLCEILDHIFVTCYTLDSTNSKVLMFDLSGNLVKTITLDNNSHVGGISYNKENSSIFICNKNGYVNSYPYDDFIKGNFKNKKDYQVADESLGAGFLKEEEKLVCSYLTCFNNKLYVGSFNKRENGLVKIFEIIKSSKGLSLKYLDKFIVPNKIQGLTFYQEKEEVYLFLSKSYTRIKDSQILVYKYLTDKNYYSKPNYSFSLPPMLEQISINKNGNILLLFESFAKKYKDSAKVVTDSIIELELQKIIIDCKN